MFSWRLFSLDERWLDIDFDTVFIHSLSSYKNINENVCTEYI